MIDLFAKGTYCADTECSNRKYFPAEIIPAKGAPVEPGNFCFVIGKYTSQEKDCVQGANQDKSSSSGKDKDHVYMHVTILLFIDSFTYMTRFINTIPPTLSLRHYNFYIEIIKL